MVLKANSRLICAALLAAILILCGVVVTAPALAKPQNAAAAQKKDPKANTPERKQAEALLKKALIYVRRGDITNADLCFVRAVKKDPTWEYLLEKQSLFYLGIKNYPNAAAVLEKLQRLRPKDEDIKRSLGQCYISGVEYEKARPIWTSIAEKNPGDVDAKINLSRIAYHDGDNEAGDRLVNEAFELRPNDLELMFLKAKVDLRNSHYQVARASLEEILEALPEEHPLREQVKEQIELAKTGIRNKYIFEGIIIAIPIIGICLGIYIYRLSRKIAFKAPPMDLDGASEDSVCRFVLTHITNITTLPRGLIWTVTLDERYLELQVSELIASQSTLALSPIDKKALVEWVESHGRAPFLFKVESTDPKFNAAFPNLVNDLEGVEINVGVPILWKDRLLGMALLGRSRASSKAELRKRFDDFSSRIQDVAEQGAVALDRLRQRHLKVIDSKTSLYNRDYFEANLVNIYRGCHIANVPLCLFMMKMDQYSAIYDEKDEEYCTDVLYALALSIQKALTAEVGVTLCHLDNGVFALIAPERTAEDGENIANALKAAIEATVFQDPDIHPTGCVAYGVYPEDADEPKMLRSITGRAFRDANYLNGNRVVRAEKVSKAGEGEEKEIVEEVVVSRRSGTGVDSSELAAAKAATPFGVSPMLQAVAMEKDKLEKPLTRIPSPSTSFTPTGLDSSMARAALEGSAVTAAIAGNEPAPIEIPKIDPEEEGDNYTIVPDLDSSGVDNDTQFCGSETFADVVNYEVSLAEESGEPCSVVYLHLDNLSLIRSKGKSAYLQLRHDLSALICAFLREDIDVPGLVGEDDFAVFLSGTDKDGAMRLADRINLTAVNLDAKGCFVIPAIGVAVRKSGDHDGVALIERAQRAVQGKGIHVAEELA